MSKERVWKLIAKDIEIVGDIIITSVLEEEVTEAESEPSGGVAEVEELAILTALAREKKTAELRAQIEAIEED